jgi:5-methylcytosine-specific restriction endonuclease McrA
MSQTVLLNADYSFLNVINWQRAIKLIVRNKVEVVEEYADKVISNAEKTVQFLMPKVLRLVNLVRSVYKNKVKFSKRNVLVRDGYACIYCGSQSNLTLDHVIPRSKGGKSNFENCVTCCRDCNFKKGNRTPKEAHMRLLKRPYRPTVIDFLIKKMKKTGLEEFFDLTKL